MTTTTTEAFETGLRVEFEAWAKEQKLFSEMAMHRRDMAGSERFGEYVNPLVQFGWLAYRAATERAAKQEWQDIATAPKDGRMFIAYRPLAEKTHDPVISLVSGQEFNRGCWESTVPQGMDGTNYTSGYCKATHWMPLPAAPNAAAIRASSGKGESDV